MKKGSELAAETSGHYGGFKTKELLTEYIRMGGFPIVALSNFDEGAAYQIVEEIYNSVITSDITKRHNITNFDLFNRPAMRSQ